jgi:curved DNA-binding protein CbpA
LQKILLSAQNLEKLMPNSTSSTHYDTLEVSRNASNDAIERMFRHLATKHHPDAGGDKATFNRLVQAFDTLRNPDTRAAYDQELNRETQEISRLVENSKQAGPDAALRHELLCLFYARRREQGSSPALGEIAIQKTLNLEEHVIEFHLWYFKEKGWIARWESGGYTITAEGVDQIDATELRMASNQLRIASAGSSTTAQGTMVPA